MQDQLKLELPFLTHAARMRFALNAYHYGVDEMALEILALRRNRKRSQFGRRYGRRMTFQQRALAIGIPF